MADRKNTGVLKCAILTMSFVQMGTNGIAPILAQIAAEFPSASSSAIQFLMTFPSIFCVIFTMLAALLSNRLPKKILALAGLSIVSAGAFWPVFSTLALRFCLCGPRSWASVSA